MRELHYGSGVITVSFDVCSAVFDYTVALANAGVTDRITVPVYLDGERGFSNLLLGPTTQLYCTAGPDAATEVDAETHPEDAELLADLARKTRLLGAEHTVTPSDRSLGVHLSDID
jgi:hypothetical protein